jgi:L-2-hydroxyglutarate oxidase
MGLNMENIAGTIRNGSVESRLRLLGNGDFLAMVNSEWESSRSRTAMASRIRKHLPYLSDSMIEGRGMGGIRGSLIDSEGFVDDAMILKTDHSLHMINYNSPGATGSPFVAYRLLALLFREGFIDVSHEHFTPLDPVQWDELAASAC